MFNKSSILRWLAYWIESRRDLRIAVIAFFATSAPILGALFFAVAFLPQARSVPDAPIPNALHACYHFDAFHYLDIVEHGYAYEPEKSSTVAFFPVFPLTADVLCFVSPLASRLALLFVSNLFLLAAFILLGFYARERASVGTPVNWFLTLLLFGLAPAAFFFRMPYSESTFLFFTLLAMIGINRRWPLFLTAILTGVTTATRPVGVAVTAAFIWYILFEKQSTSFRHRTLIAVSYLPIACWGLLTYMTYQYIAFDAPLAFAQTQSNWTELHGPPRGVWDKMESLASLEPIWAGYTSDPERSWQRLDTSSNPLFSLFFWNPIFFVATAVLVFIGARKKWLTGPEIVLSFFLLAIPYVTRAYEMCMASHARFAAVVFPAYIVLGRLLGAAPAWVTWTVIGVFSIMLMTWTALYAAGHLFF